MGKRQNIPGTGDMISRKALINKLEQWQKQDGYDNGEWNLLVDVITEIKNMPLATDIYAGTNDAISREQTIDAINEYMVGKRCDTDGTMMARLINELVIKQLPPVELGTNLASHGTDAISRQAAIIQLSHNKIGDDDCDVIIQRDIETIKQMPPAEPKKGKWKNIVEGIEYAWGTCDTCGARIPMAYKYYKYCPNCGAKMEVNNESN